MEIKYVVTVEQDVTPVRGNVLASGDPEVDKEAEDAVLDRLDRGEIWAWCFVTVTAHLGGAEGSASLGCCSFADRADFEATGELERMILDAVEDLRNNLQARVWGGNAARRVLRKWGQYPLTEVTP